MRSPITIYAALKEGRPGAPYQADEGKKRILGLMAAIMASLHMQTADDLFGSPQGSPRTDKLIEVSVQWAERIMRKVDNLCGNK